MDTHILAYYYKWGRDSIKSLPIKERAEWVEFIRLQIETENNANNSKGG